MLAPDTRVLILGSFPGEASLAARQYYAHPRNHFWPVLALIVGEPLAGMPYAMRLARLRAHRIGVWDTIVACERAGSLDTAIRTATRAETERVRRAAPAVALVCFNGKTAARAAPAWRDRRLCDTRVAIDQPRVYAPACREACRVACDRRLSGELSFAE